MKIKRKILSVFFAMVMLLTILSRTINAGNRTTIYDKRGLVVIYEV